jgi:23S rRNA (adenine2030-N6)-methyltransferase
MNYRHAFHAGGFADCMKHALLVWLVRALQRKPAPIFVLDTHAGAGCYDLSADPAERSGEWRAGIGRLLDHPPAVLTDHIGLVRATNAPRRLAGEVGEQSDAGEGGPCGETLPRHCFARRPLPQDGRGARPYYPGSPLLIRTLLRPDDSLACCELHRDDHASLRRLFAGDPLVAVHHRDGWEALSALLPPKQRRGLVLIDPPYEAADEFDCLVQGLRSGHARFRTGVFAAWYPIKHRAPIRDFHTTLQASGIGDIVVAQLLLREPTDPARLNGCGVLVINPPYRFEAQAAAILAALLDRLGTRESGEGAEVIRLVDE